MTNSIWIDEKNGTVRVAADNATASRFGNGGVVFDSSEKLALDGRISTKMLVEIYNRYAAEGKTITKFTDRKTAAERTVKAILAHEPVTASKEEEKQPDEATAKPATKKAPTAKAAQKTGSRGAKGNMGKRIFPVEGKDPFTSGASVVTWNMIKADPGKTKAEYIAMGGRSNTISHAIRNGWLKVKG